jgi:uncharacterized protein
MKPGVLLDTGPLVALLDKNDSYHEQAKQAFLQSATPYRTCESVISEACFILRRIDTRASSSLIRLGNDGFYQIDFSLQENLSPIEAFLIRYQDKKISLADACLIRCAELYDEARILTFDSDFRSYRWKRNRKFKILH